MKKSVLSLLMFLLFLSATAFSQTNKPFTEGPLWHVQFVKTKPGMGMTYLRNLNDGWVKMMKQAKADGLVTDYKILNAEPASSTDWDLLLLYQIKNYAALDGLNDKMDALSAKLLGNEDARHSAAISRNDMRELLGGKMTQELIFK